jgi:hypothetical protein
MINLYTTKFQNILDMSIMNMEGKILYNEIIIDSQTLKNQLF